MVFDQESAMRLVRKVLAADYACDEKYLDMDGVHVFPAREMPGRRRYPVPEKPFSAATLGTGVVVSCSDDRLAWVEENLGGMSRDQVFSAPALLRLQELVSDDDQEIMDEMAAVVTPGGFRPAPVPEGVEMTIVEEDGLADLLRFEGFPNALDYTPRPGRPTMAATVARHDGDIVGMAGVSADCDEMWQIGIDVIAGHRVQGVGKALVSRLTEWVFARGRLPFYDAATSNIASRRLAAALGYWPAWTEIHARKRRP